MEPPRKPGKLESLLAVTSAAITMWYMTPPQERYWIRLRTVRILHRAAARLALAEGHRGMLDELAGRDMARYPVAYACSRARDALGRALDQMRP